MDEDFGSRLSQKFEENKKLYWKEVERERGGRKVMSSKVRDEDGRLVKESRAVRGRWREYLKDL